MDLRVLSRSGPPVGLADGSLTVMSRETGGAEVGLDHLTSLGHNSQTLDTSRRSQTLERKLKRRKCVADNMTVPMGMTYLEARSVKQPTMADYTKRFHEFRACADLHQLLLMKPEDLDLALVEFLQELFDRERGVNDGVRVVAACKFFLPHIAKGPGTNLPRANRALKGWNLAAPPQQRMPMPLEVMGALVGILMNEFKTNMAIRMFFQFITYLRPGECSSLTVKQLVPPQGMGTQRFNHWAILLHPSEDLIPGKTNIFDASVILDSDPWLGDCLRSMMLGKKPSDALWTDSHAEFRKAFNQGLQTLKLDNLGMTLYATRHGGATHDVLSRRRSLLEVKQRGRWGSDNSLKWYVKEARLQTEVAKVPEPIRLYGLHVLQLLPDLLTQARKVPKPPVGISL